MRRAPWKSIHACFLFVSISKAGLQFQQPSVSITSVWMGYREHKRARKERNKEAESRREGSPSVLASFQWKLFRTWETWCRSAVQSARLACGFPSKYRHERSSPSTGPLSLACLREQQTHAAKARPHTRTHTHTMPDANAYTLKWMHK